LRARGPSRFSRRRSSVGPRVIELHRPAKLGQQPEERVGFADLRDERGRPFCRRIDRASAARPIPQRVPNCRTTSWIQRLCSLRRTPGASDRASRRHGRWDPGTALHLLASIAGRLRRRRELGGRNDPSPRRRAGREHRWRSRRRLEASPERHGHPRRSGGGHREHRGAIDPVHVGGSARPRRPACTSRLEDCALVHGGK
jgi:hypothetical protein